MHHLAFQMFNRQLKAYRFAHPLERVADFLLADDQEQEEIVGDQLLDVIGRKAQSKHQLRFLCSSSAEETNLKPKYQIDNSLFLLTHILSVDISRVALP